MTQARAHENYCLRAQEILEGAGYDAGYFDRPSYKDLSVFPEDESPEVPQAITLTYIGEGSVNSGAIPDELPAPNTRLVVHWGGGEEERLWGIPGAVDRFDKILGGVTGSPLLLADFELRAALHTPAPS